MTGCLYARCGQKVADAEAELLLCQRHLAAAMRVVAEVEKRRPLPRLAR